MTRNYKIHCKSTALFVLLLGLFFVPVSAVLATAIDRMSICNLEGYPGETIEMQITLEGDSEEERTGYWYTHYKEIEGDDGKMDITTWITTEPNDYTIKQGEYQKMRNRDCGERHPKRQLKKDILAKEEPMLYSKMPLREEMYTLDFYCQSQ